MICPHCGSRVLVHYRSTNEMQCADCLLIFTPAKQ